MARRSDEREAARAEYMARKEKGGEVNLRQLADDLHLKYDTVRRWKSKDGWDAPTGRKPGGQPGNIPCPNCGKYQPFVWDGMVFNKEKWPEGGVQYRCAECGCLDNEYRWKKKPR